MKDQCLDGPLSPLGLPLEGVDLSERLGRRHSASIGERMLPVIAAELEAVPPVRLVHGLDGAEVTATMVDIEALCRFPKLESALSELLHGFSPGWELLP
jgi:hypothetical protein